MPKPHAVFCMIAKNEDEGPLLRDGTILLLFTSVKLAARYLDHEAGKEALDLHHPYGARWKDIVTSVENGGLLCNGQPVQKASIDPIADGLHITIPIK